MKIELQEPYLSNFKAGYLNTNKEPRRVVSLTREDGSRTATSYARYLMSCHLGRFLKEEEHVDHIDDNPMNDVIENLQILTQQENNAKGKSRSYITLTCPVCNKEFTKESRNLKHKLQQGKKPTCSRSCGGKYSHKSSKKKSKYNHEEIYEFYVGCKSYKETVEKFNISGSGTLQYIIDKVRKNK